MKFLIFKLLCLSALSFTFVTNAFGSPEVYPCIPESEAAIEGLLPGQSERVLEARSKPQEVTTSEGEDDGGGYIATSLKYDHYHVVVVRAIVDSIGTTSPSVVWAKNIKIGDLRSEVDRRIGYAELGKSKDESSYLVCSDAGDVYAILSFSSDRLASVEVIIDRP